MRRKCEYCDNVYPVGTSKNGLEGDDVVYWSEDPFAAEIHGDDTPHWICGSCIYDCLMEI